MTAPALLDVPNRSVRCRACSRRLRDRASIARGLGPVCAGRCGLRAPKRARTAHGPVSVPADMDALFELVVS